MIRSGITNLPTTKQLIGWLGVRRERVLVINPYPSYAPILIINSRNEHE